MKQLLSAFFILLLAASPSQATDKKVYGTASLMVVVEREKGSVAVFDSIEHELLGRVEGLGNLRHATMVFSRDARYAFVIARDGVVSKVDLLGMEVEARAKAAENSIGIAISRDNKYIMVCNYEPGGVTILDSGTLKIVKEIPAVMKEFPDGTKLRSRTVGPLDTPDNLMIFGLMEGNAVWVVDMKQEGFPVIKKFEEVGDTPYDQFITPDGRYYLVGLLNSDWMGLLDTWKLDAVKKIDVRERRPAIKTGNEKVSVYHIPHLESWGVANGLAFVPAFGEKRIIVYDMDNWSVVKSIPVAGTPLFVVVRPGGREVWVDNVGAPGSAEERTVDVISVETLSVKKSIDAGKGALDPQFTPKGEAVYISVREEDKVAVYDTDTYKLLKEFPAHKPSGIFSSDRASKFGL
ncbi:Nitrite reductase [uncultured bacterium]|nr:Nitrite reductase [uncultured bacterium]